MKQIGSIFNLMVLLVILNISLQKLTAQEYKEVIKSDNSVWRIAHKQLSGNFIDTLYAAIQIGDYIEVLYKGTMFNGESKYVGKFRSSLDNSKLWYIPPDKTVEILVFDLSLKMGDEFNFGTYTAKVDSVFYLDSLKYIEFDISTDWNEKVRFIEGVGPNLSLIWAWETSGILSPFCVCKYEDSIEVYVNKNQNFINCDLNTTNSEYFAATDLIKISPNPIQDIFEIRINSIENYSKVELQIINSSNKILFKKRLIDNRTNINISGFSSGIYFVLIRFNQKNQNFTKIIKQ